MHTAPATENSNATAKRANRDTPMLRQYLELKEQVPDCILFFRMGDFYEMFFEDARVASRVLSIALTSRDKGNVDPIPMCGVPHHAADSYLAKLVQAGFKVAVCDQVEDPRLAKGLVKRDVTRVVSPGMFTDPQHLPAKDHRFLAGVHLGKEAWGLACLDLASGEFRATSLEPGPALMHELARLEPAELVLAESQGSAAALGRLGAALDLPLSLYPGKPPSPFQARELLSHRLSDGPGPEQDPALVAAAMVWSVVLATQRREPEHVETLGLYQVANHLVLDETARRNLELFRSIMGEGRQGSLVGAIDRTSTPMGGRLLRDWLGFPLLELYAIEARHQAVEELTLSPLALQGLEEVLTTLPDIPRLVGRASLGQANPRDLAALRDALNTLPRVEAELNGLTAPLTLEQGLRLSGLEDLAATIAATLTPAPPLNLVEGGVIAPGVSQELDSQRDLASSGKGWIASLQTQLRMETGIPSLKVGFNKVFGYYIEVTNAHQDKVPESFLRKQTLTGVERYITPDLKEREAEVLGAQEKAIALERGLFEGLRHCVAEQSRPLMAAAQAVATLDVLAALARLALSQGYVRPQMTQEGPLVINGGRHPVVEQMLKAGEFVPNDIALDDQEEQIIIITGPNMAGKSTILRQAALIVLLAQAGSFVPAASARLPLVDRIFTRVGAMDDLARGRSTFMVEMEETSQILRQATPRSLVVLDEVGRGTSTFDGLSIAWAVAEHLHDLQGQGVKTLFATHYHELTELATTHPRVKNFNVVVKEYQGQVVFLRRLMPGGASRSYGIQVARLAGLPSSVQARAKQILARLEKGGGELARVDMGNASAPGGRQLALFAPGEHPVLGRLRAVEVERLSPLEALNLLNELRHEMD